MVNPEIHQEMNLNWPEVHTANMAWLDSLDESSISVVR